MKFFVRIGKINTILTLRRKLANSLITRDRQVKKHLDKNKYNQYNTSLPTPLVFSPLWGSLYYVKWWPWLPHHYRTVLKPAIKDQPKIIKWRKVIIVILRLNLDLVKTAVRQFSRNWRVKRRRDFRWCGISNIFITDTDPFAVCGDSMLIKRSYETYSSRCWQMLLMCDPTEVF